MTVESLTLNRSRRSTAGRRMTALVGKAQKDDETFWQHDTWNEVGASDESDGSYDLAEENKADTVDVFDSDFNDSESDDEDGEAGSDGEGARMGGVKSVEEGGRQRRKEMRSERLGKRKAAGAYVEPGRHGTRNRSASTSGCAARALLLKKKSKVKQRRSMMGTGDNAGIVLNLPSLKSTTLTQVAGTVDRAPTLAVKGPVHGEGVNAVKPSDDNKSNQSEKGKRLRDSPRRMVTRHHPAKSVNEQSSSSIHGTQHSPLAPPAPHRPPSSRRNLRGTTVVRSIETQKSCDRKEKERQKLRAKAEKQRSLDERKKIPTQEEMLTEAIQITEAENRRWILTRHRMAEGEVVGHGHGHHRHGKAAGGSNNDANSKGKVVSRMHSRRGCYNTITFPEIDLIPDFWRRIGDEARRAKTISQIWQKSNLERKAPTSSDEYGQNTRKCVITGLPAKYRDPKTMLPYANLEAYFAIKERYHKGGAGGAVASPVSAGSANGSTQMNRKLKNSRPVKPAKPRPKAQPLSLQTHMNSLSSLKTPTTNEDDEGDLTLKKRRRAPPAKKAALEAKANAATAKKPKKSRVDPTEVLSALECSETTQLTQLMKPLQEKLSVAVAPDCCYHRSGTAAATTPTVVSNVPSSGKSDMTAKSSIGAEAHDRVTAASNSAIQGVSNMAVEGTANFDKSNINSAGYTGSAAADVSALYPVMSPPLTTARNVTVLKPETVDSLSPGEISTHCSTESPSFGFGESVKSAYLDTSLLSASAGLEVGSPPAVVSVEEDCNGGFIRGGGHSNAESNVLIESELTHDSLHIQNGILPRKETKATSKIETSGISVDMGLVQNAIAAYMAEQKLACAAAAAAASAGDRRQLVHGHTPGIEYRDTASKCAEGTIDTEKCETFRTRTTKQMKFSLPDKRSPYGVFLPERGFVEETGASKLCNVDWTDEATREVVSSNNIGSISAMQASSSKATSKSSSAALDRHKQNGRKSRTAVTAS